MSSKNVKILTIDGDDAVPPPSPPTTTPVIDAQPVQSVSGSVRIRFGDSDDVMYIKREWYDKYPVLQQDIVYRNSRMFREIIYPLLTGETLRYSKSVDECNELGQLLYEIGQYGISLTPEQIQDIARSSGLIKAIEDVKTYIDEHPHGCFDKYKKNLKIFDDQWTKYIGLFGERFGDKETYSRFTSRFIVEILTSSKNYALVVLNMKYHNIVFEFLTWFKSVVIDHEGSKFGIHIGNLQDKLRQSNMLGETDYLHSKVDTLNVPEEYKEQFYGILKNNELLLTLLK